MPLHVIGIDAFEKLVDLVQVAILACFIGPLRTGNERHHPENQDYGSARAEPLSKCE
jgi:hypothetical protein